MHMSTVMHAFYFVYLSIWLSSLQYVEGTIMSPTTTKDDHFLTCGAWEYVTSKGKLDYRWN